MHFLVVRLRRDDILTAGILASGSSSKVATIA